MSIRNLLQCVVDLSTVKRFSQSTLCVPESVLEHTGGISIICLYIGVELNSVSYSIDMGVLLSKAIIHDFDEISTGDVARPVKYHSQKMRDCFKEMEQENMFEISKSLSETKYNNYYSLWENSKKDLEGLIVALADFICVLYKIHDEIVNRGNLSMRRYYSEESVASIINYINEINSFFPLNNIFLENLEKDLLDMLGEIGEKI